MLSSCVHLSQAGIVTLKLRPYGAMQIYLLLLLLLQTAGRIEVFTFFYTLLCRTLSGACCSGRHRAKHREHLVDRRRVAGGD